MERFGRDGPGGGGASPARDEGWRVAETVLAPASSGVTGAGLPIRTPGANLIPGTAAAAAAAGTEAPLARSPTATRDRFASFQRGVRQGRAAADPAPAGADGQAPGDDGEAPG